MVDSGGPGAWQEGLSRTSTPPTAKRWPIMSGVGLAKLIPATSSPRCSPSLGAVLTSFRPRPRTACGCLALPGGWWPTIGDRLSGARSSTSGSPANASGAFVPPASFELLQSQVEAAMGMLAPSRAARYYGWWYGRS